MSSNNYTRSAWSLLSTIDHESHFFPVLNKECFILNIHNDTLWMAKNKNNDVSHSRREERERKNIFLYHKIKMAHPGSYSSFSERLFTFFWNSSLINLIQQIIYCSSVSDLTFLSWILLKKSYITTIKMVISNIKVHYLIRLKSDLCQLKSIREIRRTTCRLYLILYQFFRSGKGSRVIALLIVGRCRWRVVVLIL